MIYSAKARTTYMCMRLVAVKLLDKDKADGEDFINEVASISKTSHVNVVSLLGFCFEGSKRALIYEFMRNGSLHNFICNSVTPKMDLAMLYEIALSTSRGLDYLHRGCKTRIVHFDIKPHYILLDEDFCSPTLGLISCAKKKETVVSMLGTRGTIGYIAPEVFSRCFGEVFHKSDVYSYGMMVLEMTGARKIDEVDQSTSESVAYFPECIYKQIELSSGLRVEGLINEREEETARKKMILVSLWCIQTNPVDRPSMSKVVEILEGDLQFLSTPPKPFFCSPAWSPQYSPASWSSSSGSTTVLQNSITR